MRVEPAALDQRLGDSDTVRAGQVIVAGARPPEATELEAACARSSTEGGADEAALDELREMDAGIT